jgi:hypothetical protein
MKVLDVVIYKGVTQEDAICLAIGDLFPIRGDASAILSNLTIKHSMTGAVGKSEYRQEPCIRHRYFIATGVTQDFVRVEYMVG